MTKECEIQQEQSIIVNATRYTDFKKN